jgi:hypothetical protein
MLPPIALAIALEETKFYCGLGRCGGGLTEAADGCVAHRLREILEQSDLVGRAPDGPAGDKAVQELFLAHRADPAWHALPARLIAEELGDPENGLSHVGLWSEDQDHT